MSANLTRTPKEIFLLERHDKDGMFAIPAVQENIPDFRIIAELLNDGLIKNKYTTKGVIYFKLTGAGWDKIRDLTKA